MQRAKMVAVVHLAFLGLCWLSVRLASPASAAELEKLNVVYSTIATASLTTWVLLEAGFYNKYGLDTNLIYVAGSQAIMTLISGDAQIAQASGATGDTARLAGSDVSLIGAIINVIPMSLVGTPGRYQREGPEGQNLGSEPLWVSD